MPIANGDATGTSVPLIRGVKILDHTTALNVLSKYDHKDGLDIGSLLDSNKNGALTYNDFLVLPGYIGTSCLNPITSDLTSPRLSSV